MAGAPVSAEAPEVAGDGEILTADLRPKLQSKLPENLWPESKVIEQWKLKTLQLNFVQLTTKKIIQFSLLNRLLFIQRLTAVNNGFDTAQGPVKLIIGLSGQSLKKGRKIELLVNSRCDMVLGPIKPNFCPAGESSKRAEKCDALLGP